MKADTKKIYEKAQKQFNSYDTKTRTRLQKEMVEAYHRVPNAILMGKTQKHEKEVMIYINIVKREMMKRGQKLFEKS